MPTFRLNKLVRDKLLDSYMVLDQKPKYRYLKDDEHIAQLLEKIAEEVREIATVPPGQVADELADAQQILDDLKKIYGVDDATVSEAQRKKYAKNGGFEKGIFIESLTLHDDDEWVEYYRREPEKYPES